jgi:hypothetical protein
MAEVEQVMEQQHQMEEEKTEQQGLTFFFNFFLT